MRGYHPLLAVAAGTGDVLMARLREGRAATVRGAAHFLREAIGWVRGAGASGALTMRADSGFYAHEVVAVCRAMNVRFSITARFHGRKLRNLIEAIPETAWTPIPYWIAGGADVAEIAYTPFAAEQDAVPVRLIVRRVRPKEGSQLALLVLYDYHPFITDREGDMLELEADHRRHAEIENAIRDLSTGWGSTACPRVGPAPPTPPGSPSRSSPTTWRAGWRASGWAPGSSRPRPCAGASLLSPGGSPARRDARRSICRSTGRGLTSSPSPCARLRAIPLLPDRPLTPASRSGAGGSAPATVSSRRFGASFASISSPIGSNRTIDHPIIRSDGLLGPRREVRAGASVDPGLRVRGQRAVEEGGHLTAGDLGPRPRTERGGAAALGDAGGRESVDVATRRWCRRRR